MITIKSIIQTVLLSLALMCCGTAFALEGALLGLTTGVPLVSGSPAGSCSYENGVLTIDTTPTSISFDGDINTNDVYNTGGTALGGSLIYSLNIDNLGNLSGGSLTMSGLTQDTVSGNIYGLAGPLLLGDIIDFGIRDDGLNDVMDIRATLTGGELEPLFPANSDIASVLLLNISDYAYSSGGSSGFGSSWTCLDPKADVGPIGGDEITCDLVVTKTVDKTTVGPFPPVGDDSDSDSDSDSGQDNDQDGDSDNSDLASSGSAEDDSAPDPTDCGCKGKVSYLKMVYSGPTTSVTITRKPHDVVVFGPQSVATGDIIELFGPLSGPKGFQGTLGTRIEIMASPGGITEIHTSCSQPIGPGLVVGDWEVLEGTSKKLNVPLCPIPPTPCAGEEVNYHYTVTNNGSPVTGVNLVDVVNGVPHTVNDAPFDLATGGFVEFFEENVCITQTTCNIATASGTLPDAALCTSDPTPEVCVEVLLPPDPECPPGGGSDSDSGSDGNGNGDSDDTDSDSGDKDCDADSEDDPAEPMSPQGCSPGYWKQRHHFDSWVGFDPGATFEDAFPGAGAATGNKTLIKVLKTRGGKSRALGRHAVAGMLNALALDGAYPYTPAQVQDLVNEAYATGTGTAFNTAKDILRAANQLGCPLN